MDHIHFPFDAEAGDTVEVAIDRAANVQLLDPENYDKYRQKQGYSYSGGYATTTPVHLPVPHAGRWHVVVDLGGGAGHVRAAAQVLAGSAA